MVVFGFGAACGAAMRKAAVALAPAGGGLAVGATPAFANLLVNGSAETGDIVPWVATASGSVTAADAVAGILSVDVVQDNKPLSAFEGDRFFSFSESSAFDEGNRFVMTQTGTLPGGAALLTLGGVFSTEFEDFGTAALALFDAGAGGCWRRSPSRT